MLFRSETLLKHAMHAAAMVGLLGFLAAAYRFTLRLAQREAGWDDTRTLSAGGMTILCLVFVGLCVNSFIQARRRRAARAAAGSPP